jgi:hypothetical protein
MPPGSEWHAVSAAPTVEEIDAIRQISDPVVRNLLITQAYHCLAQTLAQRAGAGANWCHFATWASRQAGQTIRGEDLVETLRHRLRLPASFVHPIHSLWRKALAAGLYDPSTRLGRIVRAVQGPLDPFEHASEAVARGNRKVFEEIGREFARFLAGPGNASAPDAAVLEAFVAVLRDGDPPDGQRLLRQAFTRYHAALFEPDAARRAASLYVANLEVGWHEQTRLQPEIQQALEAPAVDVRQLGMRLLAVVRPASVAWIRSVRVALAQVLGAAAWPFARAARRLAREVITDCLMMMRMPGDRVLRLGRNLEVPYPDSLRTLTDKDAVAVVGRFRCDASGVHDCGAEDWARLEERMHFIAHLFRAFQEDPSLASAPFTRDQLAAISAGRIPEGDL